MRAIVMSARIFVAVQDIENVEVAEESEDGGGQHVGRFLYDLFIYYPASCLHQ